MAEPFQTKDASGNVLGDSRDNPILIESAEQLAYLAKEINEGTKENNISRGKYYRPENTGQPLESMDRNFRDPLTETER